jgi:hypothetical protein
MLPIIVAGSRPAAAVVGQFVARDTQKMLDLQGSLDQTMVPDDLREQVSNTFRVLADQAKTVEDLQDLAAALFNLRMPPEHIMHSASGIIIAINRINPSNNFLPFMLVCPAAPDDVMAIAAAAAVAEIKEKDGKINEGFRINAPQWFVAFERLMLPDLRRPEHLNHQYITKSTLPGTSG